MSDAPRPFSRATLFVLFSACCFGSISTFVTLAITSGARLVDVLAWRYAGAALLLAAASGGAAIRAPGRRAWAMVVLLGGGQAAIAFVSLSALRYIPVATLTFLFYTYPAWVAAIAAVRRTEPLTTRRTAALVLSLTGIAVMVGTPGSGGLHPIGVLLALSSALLYAVYIPLIDRLGRGIPPSVTSTYAAGGAGIVLIVVALSQGALAVRFAPLGWFAVFMLAVVCTVLAFLAFLRGLSEIGPVRTAIISTVEPFWTALLGNVVLGQSLGPRTLAGGVLIAAAVIVLQLGHRASAAPIEASA